MDRIVPAPFPGGDQHERQSVSRHTIAALIQHDYHDLQGRLIALWTQRNRYLVILFWCIALNVYLIVSWRQAGVVGIRLPWFGDIEARSIETAHGLLSLLTTIVFIIVMGRAYYITMFYEHVRWLEEHINALLGYPAYIRESRIQPCALFGALKNPILGKQDWSEWWALPLFIVAQLALTVQSWSLLQPMVRTIDVVSSVTLWIDYGLYFYGIRVMYSRTDRVHEEILRLARERV